MMMSEKRKTAVYNAIAEPVMDMRLRIARGDAYIPHEELDELLFKLSLEIHKRVEAALGIDQ